MKLLFLSRWFPHPPDNGSKIRIYNLIKQLSRIYEIDLVSFCTVEDKITLVSGLDEVCHSIIKIPYNPFRPNSYRSLTGLFSSAPRYISATYSQKFQDEINRLVQGSQYDVVIASQLDMSAYVSSLSRPVKILEEVELTRYIDNVISQRNLIKQLRNHLTLLKLKYYLRGKTRNYHAFSVVSKVEADRLKEILPEMDRVWIVPNGVDCAYYHQDDHSRLADSIIYTGSLTYDANLDAVRYFVESIFPIIRGHRPECQLFITGSTKGVAIDELMNVPGVNFTGYLDDIRPLLSSCCLLIVPLRIGGGTRGKILESLAIGTPVVSSSKGAEGLDLVNGEDLLIADNPEQFAHAVVHLLEDSVFYEAMRMHGQKKVITHYDWDVVGNRFLNLIHNLTDIHNN